MIGIGDSLDGPPYAASGSSHTLQICGPTQPWSVYHRRTTGGTVNLYRITQTVNREYDTYGGAVVVAASEEAARLTHPSPNAGPDWTSDEYRVSEWVNPADVTVTLLGVADPSMPAGVVLSSFRAG